VPERPPLPKPERLNRNALTVAAVIMGTLVVAAVIFMPPGRPAAGSGIQPAPIPATGTFLDQPVAGPFKVPATPPAGAAPGTPMSAPIAGAPPAIAAPDPYAAASPAAPVPPVLLPSTPPPNPRRVAYEAALSAPLTASEARRVASASANGPLTIASAASTGEVAMDPTPATAPTAEASAPNAPPTRGLVGGPPNLASSHDHFLATARAARTTVVQTSVAPAPGPFALLAGTMIPAVLVTEVNSDLPGEVLAQVARDVFDSRTQRQLLVPKGARLLGVYEHEVGAEQRRLLVAWTRLIFPDGRSVPLPALQAKDRSGAGGLTDRVDRHEGRVFGTAALLSLIGAGAQLAQPKGGYGAWGSAPSTGQIMAGATGQQLADVATQMLRRDLDVRPTIRVRQGMPFNVFLNVDLTFAAPYVAAPDAEP
jgi:type IV secretion system protein VirB10